MNLRRRTDPIPSLKQINEALQTDLSASEYERRKDDLEMAKQAMGDAVISEEPGPSKFDTYHSGFQSANLGRCTEQSRIDIEGRASKRRKTRGSEATEQRTPSHHSLLPERECMNSNNTFENQAAPAFDHESSSILSIAPTPLGLPVDDSTEREQVGAAIEHPSFEEEAVPDAGSALVPDRVIPTNPTTKRDKNAVLDSLIRADTEGEHRDLPISEILNSSNAQPQVFHDPGVDEVLQNLVGAATPGNAEAAVAISIDKSQGPMGEIAIADPGRAESCDSIFTLDDLNGPDAVTLFDWEDGIESYTNLFVGVQSQYNS